MGMFGFNDQNARVLVAVPFGLAWIAVGAVLCSGMGLPEPTSLR